MSTPVTYNGNSYNVPAYQDTGYAQGAGNLSSYLIALATGSLTLAGGSFTLTADANFGASFGLISSYFTSRSSNAATAGALRLANTDRIEWRDNASANNLILAMNATQTGGGTYTIPDVGVGTSASFVMTAAAQTIAGAKTFSGGIVMSGATIAMGSQKITGLANGTASTDAAAFGQIKYLQAVQGTSSGGSTSTSSTFAALGPTVSITPASASNRVKITVTGTLEMDTANKQAQATITRGGTNLGGTNGFVTLNSATTNLLTPMCIVFIDSPATTSSTTYDVRFRNTDGTTTLQFGQTAQTAVIIAEEIV